ncbi:MAG: superoxide dismutase [Fe] [Legionellales bacterium]|nr:superoxide dismutase [Fe] [Legionellales bacterium]OUX66129.1 MAG: superoxide dismutase [Fe] [Gammaproteobacteria bacterium TMED281]|tara:strand:- start:1332 stop:1928 length:597 start_codon:yes stop_codon:yes gene_type:complete
MHQLPPLPYEKDGLEPFISVETLEYHYGKHHKTYVDKLNGLIVDTPEEGKSLEELIRTKQGGIFNNAAQVWNHTFYWNCLTPEHGLQPSETLMQAICKDFGSFDDFVSEFSSNAANNFGSGWTWLVKDKEHKLHIINTQNADTPIRQNVYAPLLTCDVWEHAYYIDTRNNRLLYIENFFNVINWHFVEENFEKSFVAS